MPCRFYVSERTDHMRLIGITGSIACGKSTVSRELLRKGYPVIDGDMLSRELTGPGGAAIDEIRAAFGDLYVLSNGSLNRREMGRLVFSDPLARNQLDRIMAPHLKSLTLRRIEESRSSGAALCFLDFPLLYEKGYDQYCDSVWCIWLPEDLQLHRLMERDGYSRDEAMSRIKAVMSSDEKANRSAVVIDNSGPIEDTLQQVEDQLNIELSRIVSVPRRRRNNSSSAVPDQIRPHDISDHRSMPSPVSGTVPDTGFDRPDSARRKQSERKTSWVLPGWIRVSLVSLAFVLTISFTAQMLMNAYLVRRCDAHESEQRAIDEQYPLLYRESIIAVASEYNLAPSLIAAVIMNESSFRPAAESSVGARGLMQVMPDTAEWIAHKMRLDDYHLDQLLDPETNIRFGCWYLNYLSTLFNGNPLCVICAYHAGQGEISSWLSNPTYSSDGITLNLSSLPEGPTKQYAGRVTRDYGIYKAKYFNQSGLISSLDYDDCSD